MKEGVDRAVCSSVPPVASVAKRRAKVARTIKEPGYDF